MIVCMTYAMQACKTMFRMGRTVVAGYLSCWNCVEYSTLSLAIVCCTASCALELNGLLTLAAILQRKLRYAGAYHRWCSLIVVERRYEVKKVADWLLGHVVSGLLVRGQRGSPRCAVVLAGHV